MYVQYLVSIYAYYSPIIPFQIVYPHITPISEICYSHIGGFWSKTLHSFRPSLTLFILPFISLVLPFPPLLRSRHKKQRTVYRLTLLKDENMYEIDAYAALVKLGQPDLIEVKSVTFCGTSDASSLTFENVPFHAEVVEFCQKMCVQVNECARRRRREAEAQGLDCEEGSFEEYAIASEHQHSNLVLIAKKSYNVEGRWHTWIDYPKYHELWKEWKDSGGKKTFCSTDYMAPTPDWACYGAPERGMDPLENRRYHNRTIRRAKEGLLSKEQLAQYPSNPAEQEPGLKHESSSASRKRKDSEASETSTYSEDRS